MFIKEYLSFINQLDPSGMRNPYKKVWHGGDKIQKKKKVYSV